MSAKGKIRSEMNEKEMKESIKLEAGSVRR